MNSLSKPWLRRQIIGCPGLSHSQYWAYIQQTATRVLSDSFWFSRPWYLTSEAIAVECELRNNGIAWPAWSTAFQHMETASQAALNAMSTPTTYTDLVTDLFCTTLLAEWRFKVVVQRVEFWVRSWRGPGLPFAQHLLAASPVFPCHAYLRKVDNLNS